MAEIQEKKSMPSPKKHLIAVSTERSKTAKFTLDLLSIIGVVATVVACAITFVSFVTPNTISNGIGTLYPQATSNPVIVTAPYVLIPLPTYTLPPTYTPYPTQTPLPTYTPYPTQTPLPTYTFIPQPTNTIVLIPTTTPIPVNIAYDFKNSFPGPFTVEYGDAFVVDDYVTTNDRFQISYGDIQWTDYRIEIDGENFFGNGGAITGVYLQIDVRALDSGNSMRLGGQCNGIMWQEVIDGSTQNMSSNFGFPCSGKLIINVKGDKFWVEGKSTVTRPGHSHGKVFITFSGGQKIKGIRISPLP
jgi:hypothetical protein